MSLNICNNLFDMVFHTIFFLLEWIMHFQCFAVLPQTFDTCITPNFDTLYCIWHQYHEEEEGPSCKQIE